MTTATATRRWSEADLARPVLLGADITSAIEAALIDRQVPITRQPGHTPLMLTADPAAVGPEVRWVHTPTMGVEHLVSGLPATVRWLTRTIHGMPERIASYVVATILAERWRLGDCADQQRQHIWRQLGVPTSPGFDRALVVGTGLVGRAVARAVRPWFAEVVGANSTGVAYPEYDAVVRAADLAWGQADVVVVALPLTPGTRGLVSAEALARLNRAHLVLVGRGATVDFTGLRAALTAGQVRHATIDVTDPEPPDPASWLWNCPEVTLTPHISGRTHPDDVAQSLAQARHQVATGHPPPALVHPDRGY
jgi:glyoxylate/hydroxypyruvate reductase A